jgi:hypothetical protein
MTTELLFATHILVPDILTEMCIQCSAWEHNQIKLMPTYDTPPLSIQQRQPIQSKIDTVCMIQKIENNSRILTCIWEVAEELPAAAWRSRCPPLAVSLCGILFCRVVYAHRSPRLQRPSISAAPLVDLRRQSGSEVWEDGRDLDHGGDRGIVLLGLRGRGGAARHGCITWSIRVIMLSSQSE